MSALSLFVLGSPRIEVDGERVEVASRKAIALLAYLAMTARPHSRDSLAALFWPESSASQALGSLRFNLSVLRKAIGSERLRTINDSVELVNHPSLWLDVAAFRSEIALTDGHQHAPGAVCQECLSHLSNASAIGDGEFLAGFTLPDCPGFEEWRFFEGESLRGQQAEVLSRLADLDEAGGDYEQAIAAARRWLSLDPLHEPAHRALMRLYALAGQRAAALRQYEECARLLARELNAEPEPETQALHAHIKTGSLKPAVAQWPKSAAGGAPAEPPPFIGVTAPTRPLFVGREAQLARLHAHMREVAQGRGQVVFISGEAGAGKTSLLIEFMRQVTDHYPDLLVAYGACSALAGMGDPYQPFREIVALLTGDVTGQLSAGIISRAHAERLWRAVPEVIEALASHAPALPSFFLSPHAFMTRAESVFDASAVVRLRAAFDASSAKATPPVFAQYSDFLHRLAEAGPLLIVLDDLQWSDPATTGLLFHLSRAIAGTRILIIGAYRPEEIVSDDPAQHPLSPLLSEVKRTAGDAWIALDLIGESERMAFVNALVEAEAATLGADFRRSLFAHTEGHALFTVETLRDLGERGILTEQADPDWATIPSRVEGMIEKRAGRLSPTMRRLLQVASIEGENFMAQVAAHVANVEERTALQCFEQELARGRQLVASQGADAVGAHPVDWFRFRHNLFQRHFYASLGDSERRSLHADTAAALEALYGDQTDGIAPELGWHYEQSHQNDRAAAYLIRAGDQARLTQAHDAAIGFYRRAVALWERDQNNEALARTLMRLALTYNTKQDHEQAGRAHQQAFEAWGRAGHAPRGIGMGKQRFRLVMNNGITAGSLTPMTYRGLVTTSADMEVLPDIAASWEIERAGTRYVFQLRGDARWSDGSPVTAEDFDTTWRQALRPGGREEAARLLLDIRGAEAYHNGEATDPDGVGIWARDPRTLVVDLQRPTSSFLYALTAEVLHPAPAPHRMPPAGPPAEPEQWIVNGPYRVQEFRRGRVLLTRNMDYRGRFDGNVDEIEAFEYDDCTHDQPLGLAWYHDGQIDELTINDYPAEIRHRAMARHPGEVMLVPQAETWGFAFNITTPPFDDILVRRAFCMAFDRERFGRVLREPVQPATGGALPPRIMGYAPRVELAYDRERARALLAKAGYPGGRGLPRLSLINIVSTGSEEDSHAFEEMYTDNLGIDQDAWEIRSMRCHEWFHIMCETRQEPGSVAVVVLAYLYPDPDCYLRLGYETMIRNHGGWQDPEYDRLISEARTLSDPTARERLYRCADVMLVQQAGFLPWTYAADVKLVKPWVKRFPQLPDGAPQFEHTIIEPH